MYLRTDKGIRISAPLLKKIAIKTQLIEVFKSIQLAKPPRIYIAADGAREGVNGEQDKVDHIREFLTNNIDWDCEVFKNYSEKNILNFRS